jgi:hypothetical protein
VLVQRGQELRLSEPLQATRVALRRLASSGPRSTKALGGGLYEAVPVGSSILGRSLILLGVVTVTGYRLC